MVQINIRKTSLICPLSLGDSHTDARNYLISPFRLKDMHDGKQGEQYVYGTFEYIIHDRSDETEEERISGKTRFERLGHRIHASFWNTHSHNQTDHLWLIAIYKGKVGNDVRSKNMIFEIPLNVACYIYKFHRC